MSEEINMTDLEYAPFELMAVAGARELKDGEIVCVGLGLPIVSSFLAKLTHAPHITILLELGVLDPEPLEIGVDGLSDPRIWYRAKAHTSFADMLGSVLHKGLVDVGFLGALEVDAYGNLNTTLLGDPKGKYRRFTGSGGGNDIASCARRTVVTIRHEARKLNEAVSFITSPGYLHGGDERGKAGLMGAPSRVITDKAIFDFDPESKRMRLMSIHPNTTLEDVLSNMNFKPIVPDHLPITEPPTVEQVRLIREEIDPEKAYAGS
jgi:acyl CoA:acetate/3-ketoacid CoA transferase beta subunit